MLWDAALGSVIEVAISLAGFSGIVAAVGRRGAGHWDASDQLLLRILLFSSGAALFFAFLPFALIDVFEPSLVWRVLSGLLGIWLLGIAIVRMRQGAALGMLQQYKLRNALMFCCQLATAVLLFANALWFGSPSSYVVGVLWQTAISFITFITLLLTSWQQAPNENG